MEAAKYCYQFSLWVSVSCVLNLLALLPDLPWRNCVINFSFLRTACVYCSVGNGWPHQKRPKGFSLPVGQCVPVENGDSLTWHQYRGEAWPSGEAVLMPVKSLGLSWGNSTGVSRVSWLFVPWQLVTFAHHGYIVYDSNSSLKRSLNASLVIKSTSPSFEKGWNAKWGSTSKMSACNKFIGSLSFFLFFFLFFPPEQCAKKAYNWQSS